MMIESGSRSFRNSFESTLDGEAISAQSYQNRTFVNGPEQPVLVERLVQLVPLRYTAAALVWAMIVGSPVFHLLEYIDMGMTTLSLEPAHLYADFLFTAIPFYTFCAVRYLRQNILRGEKPIVEIMTEGENAYHRAFGRLGDSPPVILLTILLAIVGFGATIRPMRLSILPIASTILLGSTR